MVACCSDLTGSNYSSVSAFPCETNQTALGRKINMCENKKVMQEFKRTAPDQSFPSLLLISLAETFSHKRKTGSRKDIRGNLTGTVVKKKDVTWR